MDFLDKLNGAIARNQSLFCVELNPDYSLKTEQNGGSRARVNLQDNQWLEQLQALIATTTNWVCAYLLPLESYSLFGSRGTEALELILASIPDYIPVILDAKHSNLRTSWAFAESIFTHYRIDAITLVPYAGQDHIVPFLLYPGRLVFVLCGTANSSAAVLQEYPTVQSPFYLHLVKEAKTWGTPEQIGLEVGATTSDTLARIRAAAPERTILVHSPETVSRQWLQSLVPGFNANGDGLILALPGEFLREKQLPESLQTLCDTVNQVREQAAEQKPTCLIWMPNVCLLQQQPHEELILQLFDIGCIQFGEYVQASGAVFSYYIDLRRIISNPQIFSKILNAYTDILEELCFDRIAGIPYGALPTATGLALQLQCPMIFPRKEVKEHGTRRLVEGDFQLGETVVVVDDILITGRSAMEGARKLQSVGLKVTDIVVFIDHEKAVKETLRENGYQGHAALTISEIAETLYAANRIDAQQFVALTGKHDSRYSNPTSVVNIDPT